MNQDQNATQLHALHEGMHVNVPPQFETIPLFSPTSLTSQQARRSRQDDVADRENTLPRVLRSPTPREDADMKQLGRLLHKRASISGSPPSVCTEKILPCITNEMVSQVPLHWEQSRDQTIIGPPPPTVDGLQLLQHCDKSESTSPSSSQSMPSWGSRLSPIPESESPSCKVNVAATPIRMMGRRLQITNAPRQHSKRSLWTSRHISSSAGKSPQASRKGGKPLVGLNYVFTPVVPPAKSSAATPAPVRCSPLRHPQVKKAQSGFGKTRRALHINMMSTPTLTPALPPPPPTSTSASTSTSTSRYQLSKSSATPTPINQYIAEHKAKILPQNHIPARGRGRAHQLETMTPEQVQVETEARLEKNRLAAKAGRVRQKEQVSILQARIAQLERYNRETLHLVEVMKHTEIKNHLSMMAMQTKINELQTRFS